MAATRIILSDDVDLTVTADLKDLQQDIYAAMNNGGWLLIQPKNGPRVSINPRKVLYMEEVRPGAGRAARPSGAVQKRAASARSARVPA